MGQIPLPAAGSDRDPSGPNSLNTWFIPAVVRFVGTQEIVPCVSSFYSPVVDLLVWINQLNDPEYKHQDITGVFAAFV